MVRYFILPCIVLCLMQFGPGYLWLRTVRLPRSWALCIAPVVSYGLVGLLGEAYALAGVPAVPLTIFSPLVAVPALLLLVRWARGRQAGESAEHNELPLPHLPLWIPLAFALVGFFAFRGLALFCMESPIDINQSYDVVHHLSIIQCFVDAQKISSLHVGRYIAAADQAIMPHGTSGVYPAGWHALCALLVEALGIRVPLALNASLMVSIAVTWPLAICALAALVFEGDRRTLLFCALTCIAFVAFPWMLLVFGPLYPNMAGFCLTPATGALLMILTMPKLPLRQRAGVALAFVAAGAGQTLLHPNTIFTVVVLMTPYCTKRAFEWAHDEKRWGYGPSFALAAAFVGLVLAVWVFCYNSSLFAAATSENWNGFAYPWQEFINILTQTYTLFFNGEFAAQVVLGLLVVIGSVRIAYTDRRWILISYVLFCFIAFVGATHYDDLIKHLTSGFWYTDASRLASMCCIAASLLAAYGLSWVADQVLLLVGRYNAANQHANHPQLTLAVVSCLFLTLNFMPGFNWPGLHSSKSGRINAYRKVGREYETNTVRTTFGDYHYSLQRIYSKNTPVDAQEMAFLEAIIPIVGDDLVINNPMDGSVLAYGMDGIRTYYRNFVRGDRKKETDESNLIRKHLYEYADNPEVAAAVEKVDARWVLILNTINSKSSFVNLRGDYSTIAFDGVQAVSPDTPGFELVAQNGACALYRIVR